MKAKQKISVTLRLEQVRLDIPASGVQLQWKVGRLPARSTPVLPLSPDSRTVALQESFTDEIDMEQEEEHGFFLSKPASLSLLLHMPDGKQRIGGHLLLNLAQYLNQGNLRAIEDCPLGTVSMIKFTLVLQPQSLNTRQAKQQARSASIADDSDLGKLRSMIVKYLRERAQHLQLKQNKKEQRLAELQLQKSELLRRHGQCIEGQEESCDADEHSQFRTVQRELASEMEQVRRIMEQLQLNEQQAEWLQRGEGGGQARVLRLVRSKDELIDLMAGDMADYAAKMIELSSVVIDYEKALRTHTRRLELLETQTVQAQAKQADFQLARHEWQVARELMANQLKILRDKNKFHQDELRCKDASAQQMLAKTHQRLQNSLLEQQAFAQKQAQLMVQKDKQIVAYREMAIGNDSRLQLVLRQNLELQRLVGRLTEQTSNQRQMLDSARQIMDTLTHEHNQILSEYRTAAEEQLYQLKREDELKEKAVAAQLEHMADCYDHLCQRLALLQNFASRLIPTFGLTPNQPAATVALLEAQIRLKDANISKIQGLQRRVQELQTQLKQKSELAGQLANRAQQERQGRNAYQQKLQELQAKLSAERESSLGWQEQTQRLRQTLADQAQSIRQYAAEVVDLLSNEKRLQRQLEEMVAEREGLLQRYAGLRQVMTQLEAQLSGQQLSATQELRAEVEQLRRELRGRASERGERGERGR